MLIFSTLHRFINSEGILKLFLKYSFVFVVFLWLLTRTVWLADYPHFYDGLEYFRLSSQQFLTALDKSHESTHPISLMLSQVSQGVTSTDSVLAVSTVSYVAGFIGLLLLMTWVKHEWGKKSSVIAGLVYIFLPLNWLINTNINSESITHLMMLLGLIGWYYSEKNFYWKILAFFGGFVAALNFSGVVWWFFPLVVGSLLIKKRRFFNEFWIYFGVGMGIILHLGIDSLISGIGKPARFVGMLTQLDSLLSPIGLLRAGYQTLSAFTYNYTLISLFVCVLLALLYWRQKRTTKLILLLAIGVAYFLSVVFWHGGIYGRLGGFLGYLLPLAFISIPKKMVKYALFIVSLQSIFLMKPYLQKPVGVVQEEMILQHCRENQVIISAAESTQLAYEGKNYLVTGLSNTKTVEEKIESQLNSGNQVCVTRQALNYPYRQYDGQLPHPLQGIRNDKGELESWIKSKLILVDSDNQYSLLGLYKISPLN